MTNAELISKIKAEIERLKGICTAQIKANPGQTFPFVMEMTGYDKLLSFLDTLEESENPMNQEGLEEEIDRFEDWMETYNQSDYPTSFTTRDIARHFAQWGAEHTPLPEDTVLFNKGAAEGKRLMTEEAVEGVVCYGSKGAYVESDFLGTYDTEVYGEPGDKVRIIILKEEG